MSTAVEDRARRAGPPKAVAAAVAGGMAGLVGLVALRDPLQHQLFPPCPFHAATGGWCPGCGATRASGLLLRGDLVGALHHNALWVVLAPLVAYQVVAWAGRPFGLPLRALPFPPVAAKVALAAIAAFFVVRNLPIDAVDALNPPGSA